MFFNLILHRDHMPRKSYDAEIASRDNICRKHFQGPKQKDFTDPILRYIRKSWAFKQFEGTFLANSLFYQKKLTNKYILTCKKFFRETNRNIRQPLKENLVFFNEKTTPWDTFSSKCSSLNSYHNARPPKILRYTVLRRRPSNKLLYRKR